MAESAPAPRPHLVTAAALLISVVALAAVLAGYLFGVKHYHWPLIRPLARVAVVQNYLLPPPQRRLLSVIAGQDEDRGVFASVLDTTSGSLMSKRLFRPVTMYSQPRYMYQPNLRKLMFRVGPPGFDHEMETEDTPAVRAALNGAGADFVTAAYDELGFRRTEPAAGAACKASVVFLGDSFTDGMWVGDGDTFVSKYGSFARERFGDAVCSVNMGVNGFGSLEEAWVLEQYTEKLPKPKAVVVMYFPNDVDAYYQGVLQGTVAEVDRKWSESFAYLRRIVQFGRDHAVPVVLAAIPTAEQHNDAASRARYQDKLRDFAAGEKIAYIDLMSGLEAAGWRGLYWDWDPHFTPRGHDVVARMLFQETAPLLAARREER